MVQPTAASNVRIRHLAYVSTAIAVFAVAAVVGVTFLYLTHTKPWNPLGDYPVQTVVEVTAADVVIEGIKCNDSSATVNIAGTFNWVRIRPPGFGTTPIESTGARVPGCTSTRYVNSIPEEVHLLNVPGRDIWFITGTDWPIDPETGERGTPRSWQTENFEIPSE